MQSAICSFVLVISPKLAYVPLIGKVCGRNPLASMYLKCICENRNRLPSSPRLCFRSREIYKEYVSGSLCEKRAKSGENKETRLLGPTTEGRGCSTSLRCALRSSRKGPAFSGRQWGRLVQAEGKDFDEVLRQEFEKQMAQEEPMNGNEGGQRSNDKQVTWGLKSLWKLTFPLSRRGVIAGFNWKSSKVQLKFSKIIGGSLWWAGGSTEKHKQKG